MIGAVFGKKIEIRKVKLENGEEKTSTHPTRPA
jgi:hypothetical protein